MRYVRLLPWLLGLLLCAAQEPLVVTDGSGTPLPGAVATVESPGGTLVVRVTASDSGTAAIPALPPGDYIVTVSFPGFEPQSFPLRGDRPGALPREVRLSLSPVRAQVTVTASRGTVGDVTATPQVVNTGEREQFMRRPLATIGNALESMPGIVVQETTYGQVSPHVRGLTGYHVLNLIDGIRYNNSIFRSGPNQHLAFVDPSQAGRLEAVLGPASAQYGSDSLGGSINVITVSPRLTGDSGLEAHGEVHAFGASADASVGTNAQLAVGDSRLSWLAGGAWSRHNDLRAGRGFDSHNVYLRLVGLPQDQVRDLAGNRQQDTAFTQVGAHTKLLYRPASDQSLSLWYQRGEQHGVRGYRDLLGGRGRMRSDIDPQRLNFFYARYEKLGLGALDSVSGTFSINSQRDGQALQALRSSDPIDVERHSVDVLGYSGQATSHLGSRISLVFGGDVYDEWISSETNRVTPATGTVTSRRPLYPDGSRYRTTGLFGQGIAELVPGRLRFGLGGRYTHVHYFSPAGPQFGVVESSRDFHDLTFNANLTWNLTHSNSLFALVGRGFRAPNINDLGAIGLNSQGYEIPAEEAIAAGAILAHDDGEAALSKGEPVTSLRPESLYNFELGWKFSRRRFYARIHAFDQEFHDPIARRTLLFPLNALPGELGGMSTIPNPPTPEQAAQGVGTVGNEIDRRAIKAFVNDGRSRYYGGEALVRFSWSPEWSLAANYTYIMGRDLDPNRYTRRLPPQTAYFGVTHTPTGRRPWLSVGTRVAGKQDRLSGGDLTDVRIGAARSRRDIASFFGGTRVGPYLDPSGAVFVPTGETLRQIQDRVLPLGATINGVRILNDRTVVPLYVQTDGWIALDIQGGMPLTERLNVDFGLINLLDRNYRSHGSGMDAPGINAFVGIRYTF